MDPAQERVVMVGHVAGRGGVAGAQPGVDQDPVVGCQPGLCRGIFVGLGANANHDHVGGEIVTVGGPDPW